jgi:hypothetical protein
MRIQSFFHRNLMLHARAGGIKSSMRARFTTLVSKIFKIQKRSGVVLHLPSLLDDVPKLLPTARAVERARNLVRMNTFVDPSLKV